jgi:hypothetical protein
MTSARGIVTIVLAAVVVAAAAWSAFKFVRAPSEAARASPAASNDAGAGANAADASSSKPRAEHGDRSSLAPTVTAIEPRLEWPDEASLRRMERGGRALFGGIVRAPDGSPCEGATVWFDGAVVATTDVHGAWRSDVSCILTEEEGVRSYVHVLEAGKERVGHKIVAVELPSRRIDLDLVAGLAFSGTVVDFDDGTPIGGAELELRRNSTRTLVASFTTRADELGRFAFTDLPEGAVYVRGRAPGYDSNGFVGYDFSKGHDVVVAYRLRKEFTLRGRFVPWPVAGVAVERASVRATTRSPHDRGDTKREFRGSIGPDGRFELPAPICPSCVLDLLVDEAPFWSDELDTNEERREFDVGDVALQPAAALTGRFDAPADVLARIVVSAAISTPDEKHVGVRGRLDATGAFRLAPLPPGGASITFMLGRLGLADLESASGLDDDERSGRFVRVLPGSTRDLGVVATTETVTYGTVRDADGMPVAWAEIYEEVKSTDERWSWNVLFSARTDAEGRFVLLRNFSRVSDEDRKSALEGRARWNVTAEGSGPRWFDVDAPGASRWVRRDLVLDAGVALRGTLLDASGAPRAAVEILACDVANARSGSDKTRADGSFEIRGLAAGVYRVIAVDDQGAQQFDDIHPENGPVTLRPADAVKK